MVLKSVVRLVRRAGSRVRTSFDAFVQAVRNFEYGAIPARLGELVTFGLLRGSPILATMAGLAAMYFGWGWVRDVYL